MRRTRFFACILMLTGFSMPAQPQNDAAREDKAKPVTTAQIYHYLKVDEQFITSGQPSEEQLQAAATEGFRTVINLATINPRYSLKDEDGSVRALGMTYRHIPVEWEQPTEADFAAFEAAMRSVGDEKTLIHCAANFRVTAFYSLYAMKHRGWSQAQAEEFRASMWKGSDYPVWEEFIRRMHTQIGAAQK